MDSPTLHRRLGALAYVWLALVAVLAAELRAPWLDETFAIERARGSLADVLAVNRGFEANPPLYYVALHYWLAFGESAFATRALSIASAIAALYLVRRAAHMLGGERAADVAGVVFAASAVQQYYAHEARAYMPGLALSLAAGHLAGLHLMTPASSSRVRALRLGGYALTTALAGYTLYYAWLATASQVLAMAAVALASAPAERRLLLRRTWEILAAGVIALVLYAPEIYYLAVKAEGFFGLVGTGGVASGVPQTLPDTFRQDWLNRVCAFLVGFQWSPLDRGFATACLGLALAIGAGALAFVTRAARAPDTRAAALLAGGQAFLPWLLLLAIPFRPHRFECKHLLFALPWLGIVLALPFASARRPRWAWLVIGAFLAANLHGTWHMLLSEKEDWPLAWSELASEVRPGDLVLTTPVYLRVPLHANRPPDGPLLQLVYAKDDVHACSVSWVGRPGAPRPRLAAPGHGPWIALARASGARVFVVRGISNVAIPDASLAAQLDVAGFVADDEPTVLPGGAGSNGTLLVLERYSAR